MLTLEEIRKERVVSIDRMNVTLNLEQELWMEAGKVLVTVSKKSADADRNGFTRLQFWIRSDDKYRCLETHDAYWSVELVPFENDSFHFLFVSLNDPSAGAFWTSSAIYYLHSSGELRNVILAPNSKCYFDLPPLSLTDPLARIRAGMYYVNNGKVYFRSSIWNDSDSPNFPTGGSIEGQLGFVQKKDGNFVAIVSECNILRPETEE